jgi:hypothetical protein
VTGPPDDPSDLPTRLTDYGGESTQQLTVAGEPGDDAPAPWYRNRVLIALWALLVALLVTLIVYGIVELSRGGETSVPAPHTSTTAPTRSSTTSPSTTPPTTGPSTTTESPPAETPEQTPEQAPPPPAYSPAPTQTPRHHHHWHLPHLF